MEQKEKSSLKFLVLNEPTDKSTRIFRINPPLKDSAQDESRRVFLFPGINIVDKERFDYIFSHPFIKRHGKKLPIKKCNIKPNGFSSFADLSLPECEEIIPQIFDLAALQEIKDNESRPLVLKYIDQQMNIIKK